MFTTLTTLTMLTMLTMLRTRATTTLCLVLASASTSACTQPEPVQEVVPDPPVSNDDLFSREHLPRFDIGLSTEAYAALEAEPKQWVEGSFEFDGERYEGVGVRLKGNHSFRPLGDKASFKVKFNKFTPGERFMGLEALTFNSMVVDSSMLREWISYRVFRELGVPAPRVGYSQIYVNDEPYGLYLTIEPYDDVFLTRNYADASGNLYESDQSADLDTSVDAWDQDEGEDESRDDLRAFSMLALQAGSEVFDTDQGGVDLPEFLSFLSAETIVGHFDGHIGGHNFFVYHEPTLDRWSYQPWSLDQGLARHSTPYDHEGYLGFKCLHEESCLVDYVTHFQSELEVLRGIDLQTEVDEVIALTDAAMREDPKRPYSAESVESGREAVLSYILGRAQELEPQLDCLVDGAQPDADNDGFGPCFQDCDESDPDVNPDAAEACDGIDNDCSGFVDDVPSCECPSVQAEGEDFFLCRNELTWLESRSYCEAQGRVLAHFSTESQQAVVAAAAHEIDGGRWAIGLNDREIENDYRWADGSAPNYSTWANGQPAHALDWFDCVFVRNSLWYESNCIEKGNFICTAP